MSDPHDAGGEEQPDILAEVDRLITTLESHRDPVVREQVSALLRGIDAVHRTALTHLMSAIHAMAGDAFVHRLIADPAIRLLLMSYDLVAVDRRLQAEEALDVVRGHLHAHGIDVEITGVLGGVVTVRVHGLDRERRDRQALPLPSVLHDVEEALREGLLGFQELELADRAASVPPTFVPIDGLRHPHKPVYRAVARVPDLQENSLTAVDIDGEPVLIARCGEEFFAVRNRCADSPLPLHFGALTGTELRCSWHGCRYDVRTGRRLDMEGDRLAVFPVAVEGDEVRIAIGVEPVERE